MATIDANCTKRILIMRLSAMGDVAMTAPVIGQLRKQYPNLHIVLLTIPFYHPFFREVERVEFFTPDFADRHKGVLGLIRLYHDLGRFDIVVDLHDVIRTKMLRLLYKLRGVKVVFIDKGRAEKEALTVLEKKKMEQLKSTVERYRETFTALGFDVKPIQPTPRTCYALSEDSKTLAGERCKHWVGVAAFAQHRGKIYPFEKITRVIQSLSRMPDTRIFLFGGGRNEREYAESVAEMIPNVTSVIGRLTLPKEMELISNLDCMVSMDSSAMHMASLVGVKVVSVWGATHPNAGFYGIGQDMRNAVQVDLPCRPCSVYGNKPCLYGDYHCMSEIKESSIVERVARVLKESAEKK